MIPKIIHYCWFGGKPIPERLRNYMASWRETMPEWKWQCWDETLFDVNTSSWTRGAYQAKKFAFVSDYVRLIALYEIGGIYLDTDVKLLKSLECFVNKYDAFTGFEGGDKLTSAVIAAAPRHPLIKLFLDYYDNKSFSLDVINKNEANVLMMTDICKKLGLRDDNTEQDIHISLDSSSYTFHVFPQTYFCPLDFWHNKNFTENTYAIHYFDASWLDGATKNRIEKERRTIYKIRFFVVNLMTKFYRMLK